MRLGHFADQQICFVSNRLRILEWILYESQRSNKLERYKGVTISLHVLCSQIVAGRSVSQTEEAQKGNFATFAIMS